MATFIGTGPIGFSGDYAGSVYSFITGCGGTVSTDPEISLTGLFGAASAAGITLSGSSDYDAPHAMSEFYGMVCGGCGSICCLADEDSTCFALESDGTDLDLECCPTCVGTEEDASECVLDEDDCPVDMEACASDCCVLWADETCITLVDGTSVLDLEVCP